MYGKTMMKSGGTKKPLRKAQDGMYTDTTPGEMYMDAPMPTRPMSMVPSGRGDMEGLNTPYGQFRKPEPTSEQDKRAAYGKKGIIVKKTGSMATKKMYKTGGMVNPNAKLQAAKAAGSKGVKSGVNPKAAASNVAKKPSAARSKAPKKAIPKAAYGMAVNKMGAGGMHMMPDGSMMKNSMMKKGGTKKK